MKKYCFLFITSSLLSTALNAQEENSSWSFEVGANYVNVYSVGEDAPQGEFFDEFFNVNDHWNLGSYIAATKEINERFSLTIKGSLNEISKWGELSNDESVLVDNLKYYGLDGMINFKILKDNKIKPYLAVGGGYTWIEEGLYNTFSNENGSKNLIGAGTLNGALGLTYDITNRLGINLQFVYKHSFEEYLTKHWQNSIGVKYSLTKKNDVDTQEESLVDTDADGIIDEYDLCPEIFGLKQFAGCPDTDGDGITDSLDNCPNKKNVNGGCPKVVEVSNKENNSAEKTLEKEKANTTIDIFRVIYFENQSKQLDNNAKAILDNIFDSNQNAKQIIINIDGHTDDRGDAKFNETLSYKRANSVKNYLISKGIPTNNITTNYFGETQPVTSNNSIEGRTLNRRVELKIRINN